MQEDHSWIKTQQAHGVKESKRGTFSVVQWFETLTSNARGEGLIPGWGATLPHASWPKKQNIKQK